MRSSNLVFRKLRNMEFDNVDYEVATYSGVAKKTIIYMVVTLLSALGGILSAYYYPNLFIGLLVASAICTFVFGFIALILPKASKVCGLIYCFGEGVLVGVLSMSLATVSQGIVPAALISTFMVFGVVVTLYVTNLVKITSKFKRFLLTFGIGFIISYLVVILLLRISGNEFNYGLLFAISLISTFLATLYLLLDLDTIRMIVEGGYPKEYEWYSAFGLAYTLIWLYVEILRLAAIIFGKRN